MDKDPIRVVMVDDHRLFCQAMISLLNGYRDRITVVGTCCNGEQMKTCLQQQPADVLLLDIIMPENPAYNCCVSCKRTIPTCQS